MAETAAEAAARQLTTAVRRGASAVLALVRAEDSWQPGGAGSVLLYGLAQDGSLELARQVPQAAPAAAAASTVAGRWPLHAAAFGGHESLVRLLLEAAPTSVTVADERGVLALRLAARQGHEAVVRLLLQAVPAAITAGDALGGLPLHWAVLGGHEAVVRLLLETAPAAATAETFDGFSPLRIAFDHGHVSVARAVLGTGPAAAALAALAAGGETALPPFADSLLAPSRLPLTAANWALLPSPCPGIERALPAALACSPDQAAQVARRLPPADRVRVRTAAVCLSRCCGLPRELTALILAQSV